MREGCALVCPPECVYVRVARASRLLTKGIIGRRTYNMSLQHEDGPLSLLRSINESIGLRVRITYSYNRSCKNGREISRRNKFLIIVRLFHRYRGCDANYFLNIKSYTANQRRGMRRIIHWVIVAVNYRRCCITMTR